MSLLQENLLNVRGLDGKGLKSPYPVNWKRTVACSSSKLEKFGPPALFFGSGVMGTSRCARLDYSETLNRIIFSFLRVNKFPNENSAVFYEE